MADDRSGQQLGNYRLLRLLGRGSFAEVYLGEHVSLHTRAAIKILRILMTDDNVGRFLTEARTVANLQHEHIVRVFDFDVKDDVPFLVMDYAPNGTLRSRHPGGTPLPPTVILPYVKQVAAALQYAHDHKLVHCDVKPRNILLGPADKVWLGDFGLAVIARTTSSLVSQDLMCGSPAYMAPEQFHRKPRPASDQYALGISVYEWLCGSLPFDGSTIGRLYVQHTENPPPPMREHVPEISPAVEKVVQQALAKDYRRRFERVQDFADALEAACRSEPYLLPPSVFNLFPSAPVDSFATVLPTASEESAVTVLPSRPSPSDAQAASVTQPAVPPPEVFPQPGRVAPAPAPPKETTPVSANSANRAPLLAPPPNVVPVPGIAAPPQSSSGHKRSISRRTVAVGLGGFAALLAITGTGTGVLVWHALHAGSSSAHTSTPTPTLAPTSTPTPTPTPTLKPQGYTYIVYPQHSHPLTSVSWSPVGNRIVSSDTSGQVQAWDALTGGNVVSYKQRIGEVKTVAWSPDGRYVALGGADKKVHIWDPTAQTEAFPAYTGHKKTVRSVSWSPYDGKYIVSGSDDKYVRIWEVASGKEIRAPFFYQNGNNPNGVFAVAWSPNGRYIALGGAGGPPTPPKIWVWDLKTRTMAYYIKHMTDVRSLAWSPDSIYIASGGVDAKVQVWEATTGRPRFTYSGHHGGIWSVAWSPDGRYIASGSKDKTVQIWDATSGQHIYTYRGANNEVWAVAWSPNGEYIVSGSSDMIVRVWQAT